MSVRDTTSNTPESVPAMAILQLVGQQSVVHWMRKHPYINSYQRCLPHEYLNNIDLLYWKVQQQDVSKWLPESVDMDF